MAALLWGILTGKCLQFDCDALLKALKIPSELCVNAKVDSKVGGVPDILFKVFSFSSISG